MFKCQLPISLPKIQIHVIEIRSIWCGIKGNHFISFSWIQNWWCTEFWSLGLLHRRQNNLTVVVGRGKMVNQNFLPFGKKDGSMMKWRSNSEVSTQVNWSNGAWCSLFYRQYFLECLKFLTDPLLCDIPLSSSTLELFAVLEICRFSHWHQLSYQCEEADNLWFEMGVIQTPHFMNYLLLDFQFTEDFARWECYILRFPEGNPLSTEVAISQALCYT